MEPLYCPVGVHSPIPINVIQTILFLWIAPTTIRICISLVRSSLCWSLLQHIWHWVISRHSPRIIFIVLMQPRTVRQYHSIPQYNSIQYHKIIKCQGTVISMYPWTFKLICRRGILEGCKECACNKSCLIRDYWQPHVIWFPISSNLVFHILTWFLFSYRVYQKNGPRRFPA